VGQALGQTRGAVYVHEPDNHRHTAYALRAKRGLGAFPWLRKGDDAGEYGCLWDWAFEGAPARPRIDDVVKRLQSRAGEVDLDTAVTPGARASLLTRSVAAAARRPRNGSTGAQAVIVKTVQGSLALEWIAARQRARVVVVQRHPLNVISSWDEMGFHDLGEIPRDVAARYCARWGIEPTEPNGSVLARTAWRVGFHMSVLEEVLKANPDFIGVSHDELCLSPVNGLRQLAERCGLAWSEEAEAFVTGSNRPGYGYDVHRITAEQPNRWRERLTASQVDEAMRVLGAFPVGRCEAEAVR
jgi:hypothetical protein